MASEKLQKPGLRTYSKKQEILTDETDSQKKLSDRTEVAKQKKSVQGTLKA